MNSITIITIIVISILTAIIFTLAWLGFASSLKIYKLEVNQGKHDIEIKKEYININKHKQIILKIIYYTFIVLLLCGVLALFITGITYKTSGESLTINNKTALVIKTDSMSTYYDSALAEQYKDLGYNSSLQFSAYDICIFEKVNLGTNLKLGEVYSYKYKNILVTHRLIGTYINKVGDIYYIFKGDNNKNQDQVMVTINDIVYHYVGKKIKGLGSFVLYAQSSLGIWSLVSIVGIIISSDIIIYKMNEVNKQRSKELGADDND